MSIRSKTGMLFVGLALAGVGCGDGGNADTGVGSDSGGIDSGTGTSEAGVDAGRDGGRSDAGRDTGMTAVDDTGPTVEDTGTEADASDAFVEDTGMIVIDTDSGVDAATEIDGGSGGSDAGPRDGGNVDAFVAPVDGGIPDANFMYTMGAEVEPNDDGTPSTGGTTPTSYSGNDFSISVPAAQPVLDMDLERITGSLSPAGDEDVFIVRNTASVALTFTIYTSTAASPSTCTGDTGLNLRDATGALVASDDDSGEGACSLLRYRFAPGQTLYAHVVEYGDNDVLMNYAINLSICGNAQLSPFEGCDDGNSVNTDSCSTVCQAPRCGDGLFQPGEECDDGNASNTDGCSNTCTINAGYDCIGGSEPSVCSGICGDGVRVTAEACDDNNVAAGDGCSATCTVEPGGVCTNSGTMTSVCTQTCAAPTEITVGAVDTTTTLSNQLVVDNLGQPTDASCNNIFISEDGGRYYRITLPATSAVELRATTSDVGDYVALLVQDTCAATTCVGSAISGFSDPTATLRLENTGASARTYFILALSELSTRPYTIEATRRGPACPGSSPLVVPAIDGTSSLTGQTLLGGFSEPSDASCDAAFISPRGGRNFPITVPANTRIEVRATPSASYIGLYVQNACGANTCVVAGDSPTSASAAFVAFENITAQPVTYNVLALGENSAMTYSLEVTRRNSYCLDADVLPVGAVNVPTTTTAQTPLPGIVRPTGTNCSGSFTAGGGRYYDISIPANSVVSITADPDAADRRVGVYGLDGCGGNICSFNSAVSAAAGGNATLQLTNGTNAAVTRSVLIAADGTTGNGWSVITTRTDIPFVSVPFSCENMSGATAASFLPSSSATGTALDDGTTELADLPFSFPLFGTAMGRFSISTNGLLLLHPTGQGARIGDTAIYTNAQIPNEAVPNGFLAPFWDDLYMTTSGTASYGASYTTIGTAPNRTFVVEWRARPGSDGQYLRFQVKLSENGQSAEFHYCEVGANSRSRGDSATVGAESYNGMTGSQASYNVAGLVQQGTAILLTTD